MQKITKNGQTVDCYGEYRENNNYLCIFEDEELDGVYSEIVNSWEEAVDVFTQFALENDTELVEVSAV